MKSKIELVKSLIGCYFIAAIPMAIFSVVTKFVNLIIMIPAALILGTVAYKIYNRLYGGTKKHEDNTYRDTPDWSSNICSRRR